MLHHGIAHEDVRGWLFLAAPGGLGLKLARAGKGVIEPGELGVALAAEIRRYDIGLLILDPFIKTHAVPENDNPAIDLVASSTRRDDLLLEREILQRMNLLRVYLNDMNTEEAMNELLKRMRGTKSNEEFLASMNS